MTDSTILTLNHDSKLRWVGGAHKQPTSSLSYRDCLACLAVCERQLGLSLTLTLTLKYLSHHYDL